MKFAREQWHRPFSNPTSKLLIRFHDFHKGNTFPLDVG
jgi:hypothetical protein